MSEALKHCPACGDDKPRTREFFYRSRSAGDGLQGRCKVCDNRLRGMALGDGIYDVIARELGVSPTRVKQIEQAAIRKLRRSPFGRRLASLWGFA